MTATTRGAYHHGSLRPALMAAARQLLDQDGLEAVGLREVARRVGVSATATYRHFDDKESLLAAVATEGVREFSEVLKLAMRDGGSFSTLGRAYVNFALEKPGLFRLMFSPMLRQKEKFPELAAAVDDALAFGRSQAEAMKPAGGAHDTAHFLAGWAKVHGLALLILDQVMLGDLEQPMKIVDDVLGRSQAV